MVWYPTAALSNYIKWEEIDANSAKAIMSYKGITATGIFNFNKKGEVTNFVAQRYMEKDGQYEKKTWSPIMSDYKEINGIKIPTSGEVIWKLEILTGIDSLLLTLSIINQHYINFQRSLFLKQAPEILNIVNLFP